jgi:hypothetical protein
VVFNVQSIKSGKSCNTSSPYYPGNIRDIEPPRYVYNFSEESHSDPLGLDKVLTFRCTILNQTVMQSFKSDPFEGQRYIPIEMRDAMKMSITLGVYKLVLKDVFRIALENPLNKLPSTKIQIRQLIDTIERDKECFSKDLKVNRQRPNQVLNISPEMFKAIRFLVGLNSIEENYEELTEGYLSEYINLKDTLSKHPELLLG